MTTPLKNSANNFDGSCIDIFLSAFDSFFLIGFKLVMLIHEIDLLLQSNLQQLVRSMFQMQSRDREVLCFLVLQDLLDDSHRRWV